jgi:hypothetical protein
MSARPLFSSRSLGMTAIASIVTRALGMFAIFAIIARIGAQPAVEAFLIASTYGNAYYGFQSGVVSPFLLSRAANHDRDWDEWIGRVQALSVALGCIVGLMHLLFAPWIAALLSAGQTSADLVTDIRWVGLFIAALMISAPARVLLSMHGHAKIAALSPMFSWISLGVAVVFIQKESIAHLNAIQTIVVTLEAAGLLIISRRLIPDLGAISAYKDGMWSVAALAVPLVATFGVNLAMVAIDIPAAAWAGESGVSILQTGTRLPFMMAFGLTAGMGSLIGLAVKSGEVVRFDESVMRNTRRVVIKVTVPTALLCILVGLFFQFIHFASMSKMPSHVFSVMAMAAPIIPISCWVNMQSRFFDLHDIAHYNFQLSLLSLILRLIIIAPLVYYFGVLGIVATMIIANIFFGLSQAKILALHHAGKTDIAPFSILWGFASSNRWAAKQ